MINYDYISEENTEEHNQNWPQIPTHSYRILTGGSVSRKKPSYLI